MKGWLPRLYSLRSAGVWWGGPDLQLLPSMTHMQCMRAQPQNKQTSKPGPIDRKCPETFTYRRDLESSNARAEELSSTDGTRRRLRPVPFRGRHDRRDSRPDILDFLQQQRTKTYKV
jgi:hypothetical protein